MERSGARQLARSLGNATIFGTAPRYLKSLGPHSAGTYSLLLQDGHRDHVAGAGATRLTFAAGP